MTYVTKSAIVAAVAFLALAPAAFAATAPGVQTNAATSIQNNTAILQGYLSDLGTYSNATVWFQWGTTTNYGNNTNQQTQSSTGNFSQQVTGLAANTTYHFRAAAQNSSGTNYGADMTFTTPSSGGTISVSAGPALYLSSGQNATLQGTGSDSSGNPVNYSWSCNGGTLSNYNVAQPTYTAPYTTANTTYSCTLTVSNNYGNSSSASTTIYVNQGNSSGNFSVQTNPATSIYNNQAVLNGYFTSPGSSNNYVWFQYGTSSYYGYTTSQQLQNFSGNFSQLVGNLIPNTQYHFRAVAQTNSGSTVYGQDMTFYSSGSGTYYPGNNYYGGNLTVTKRVINLTSGNLNWQSSVSANQNDLVSFSVTIQAGGSDIHNVFVRDQLPAGLIYRGNLTMNTSNYYGDITQGINIGTIAANQVVVLAYQAQVVSGYGTMTNNVTVTSNEAGTQTASASVYASNAINQFFPGNGTGPTYISTGLTNSFWQDSFFAPLLIILAALYLYFSGAAIRFADWLKRKS